MYKTIMECPVCGGKIKDYPKSYGCSNWRGNVETGEEGCKLTIWKDVYGHRITEGEAITLLNGGLVEGLDLVTKEGKEFYGTLRLEGTELQIFSTDK